MKKKVLIVVFLILIILILFKVFNVYSIILKRFYPDTYAEYVDEYSEKYGIDREWIFALIKAESNFKEESVSQSGAIGLMQLMENTAIEVSNEVRNRRSRFKRY